MFITAKIAFIFTSLTAVQIYDFHIFTTDVIFIPFLLFSFFFFLFLRLKRIQNIPGSITEFLSACILSQRNRTLEMRFTNVFERAQKHLINIYQSTSKLSRSYARKFVLSIQYYHFNSPPFVYYRGEWRADLSVNMEISAREERISFIKCRLRYILEHPFRILVYPFLTT